MNSPKSSPRGPGCGPRTRGGLSPGRGLGAASTSSSPQHRPQAHGSIYTGMNNGLPQGSLLETALLQPKRSRKLDYRDTDYNSQGVWAKEIQSDVLAPATTFRCRTTDTVPDAIYLGKVDDLPLGSGMEIVVQQMNKQRSRSVFECHPMVWSSDNQFETVEVPASTSRNIESEAMEESPSTSQNIESEAMEMLSSSSSDIEFEAVPASTSPKIEFESVEMLSSSSSDIEFEAVPASTSSNIEPDSGVSSADNQVKTTSPEPPLPTLTFFESLTSHMPNILRKNRSLNKKMEEEKLFLSFLGLEGENQTKKPTQVDVNQTKQPTRKDKIQNKNVSWPSLLVAKQPTKKDKKQSKKPTQKGKIQTKKPTQKNQTKKPTQKDRNQTKKQTHKDKIKKQTQKYKNQTNKQTQKDKIQIKKQTQKDKNQTKKQIQEDENQITYIYLGHTQTIGTQTERIVEMDFYKPTQIDKIQNKKPTQDRNQTKKPTQENENQTKESTQENENQINESTQDMTDFQNSGSEDDNDFDDQDEPHLVPRSVRMFMDDDEAVTIEDDEVSDEDVEVTQDLPAASKTFSPHLPLYDFKWYPHPDPPISPQSRREEFVVKCGPTDPPSSADPYETFVRIWDKEIMERIAAETNRYAQQYASSLLDQKETSRIKLEDWEDTDADEIYIFFALMMAIGVTVKSKLKDYWSPDSNTFSTSGFSISLNMKRFQLLTRCLHFTDNERVDSTSRSHANISKIKPIVDHLNAKFSALYRMDQNIALDDSLTLWKGGPDDQMFKKAAGIGIKTYGVCESRTGYLWRFEVCEPTDEVVTGIELDLVMKLLGGLEHTGHTVWMDGYFSCPPLARILKTLGFDCVGTLRTNSLKVPKRIAKIKKDMKVGEVRGCTSGDVDLMVWRDKNRVALISTYHGKAVSDSKPTVVRDYNSCMGGLDKKDRMLAVFPMERKTNVWYRKFFRRLLNVSILNAYIIHKHHNENITHREFRAEVVMGILHRHKNRPVLAMEEDENFRYLPKLRPIPKFNAVMVRHFPAYLPLYPRGTGQKERRQRRVCKVCKKYSPFLCKECDAGLCFDPSSTAKSCYVIYHS